MEKEPIQKEFGEVERDADKITIKKFGTDEVVGIAKFALEKLGKRPTEYFYLKDLDISSRRDQGKGFASQLLSEIERMSRETGKPVVLLDAIDSLDNPEAVGMYERRGWLNTRTPAGHSYYIYGDNREAVNHIIEDIQSAV